MKGTKEFKGRKNRTKKSESKGKPKGWSRSGIGVARNEIKGRKGKRNAEEDHWKGNVGNKVEKGVSVYRRINPYKALLRER